MYPYSFFIPKPYICICFALYTTRWKIMCALVEIIVAEQCSQKFLNVYRARSSWYHMANHHNNKSISNNPS